MAPISSCGPCSQYRVNTQATEFGQCECGHPKQAHAEKTQNKAAVALAALNSTDKKRNPRDKKRLSVGQQLQLCADYQVDVTADVFGHCLCGHPKESHATQERNPAELAKARLSSASKIGCGGSPAKPCSDYRVNTSASTFGDCICGHPKDAHVAKQLNPAEAALQNLNKGAKQRRDEEDRKRSQAEAAMTCVAKRGCGSRRLSSCLVM